MDVSGRLDPKHGRASTSLPRPGLRLRAIARWHRSARYAPLLVPVGAVLTVAALSWSIAGGAVGAVLVGIGVAASLWHPRLRRSQTWSAERRNRSRPRAGRPGDV